MTTEQQKGEVMTSRSQRSGLLRQPEIEEVDEDTSPGSDQSDTTITAGTETPRVGGVDSPESVSPDDLKPTILPKIKQLTRSEAICEGCASPPLDPLQSTASTCSTDSSSSGIGTKSLTSGSGSSSFRGRLEKDGSQSSEAGTSSSLSRDSSVDTPYKDSTGIDLEDFIKKTLNKTPKDRNMLIKLEVDLIKFIKEPKHHYLKFPQMSSYDRMLVHRIAAFFGLDHNVDQTGKCVIVNKTANTRVPDFNFQDHISSSNSAGGGEQKPKMLLKRGGGSFDEAKSRNLQKPMLDSTRAAKSLEERQQQYEEIRQRIFTGDDQGEVQPYTQEEMNVSSINNRPQTLMKDELLEPRSYCIDGSGKAKVGWKANSFGGTGTFHLQHMKSPMRCSSLNKADSLSMQIGTLPPNLGSPIVRPMLMSSPTCSQSDGSSVSGSSPSGLAPSPQQQSGSLPGQSSVQSSQWPKYYWAPNAPAEMSPATQGGVIINPQTGQPLFNPDGSVYRYTAGEPLPQVWTTQSNQESQSSQELCQQMSSVLMVSQQSSVDSDSGCPAGGDSGTIPQQVVINQNTQQQQPLAQAQPFPQQQQQQQAFVVGQQQQGVYYSGSHPVPGQQGVRYVCPTNYCISNSSGTYPQGYVGHGQGMQVDGHNQSLQFQSSPYCPQYVQGYPNNQIYSQGQFVGGQGQSSNVSYQCGGHGSVTSPVEGQTGSLGYSVPVQYNQQAMNASGSPQLYYTVQNPHSNQVQGFSSMSGQQQTTYQNNTPPSQGSSANPNVQLNTMTPQPVNVNTMNTVNIAQQQQAHGMAGQGPGTQPTQYISYPSPHHALNHAPQVPQTFNPSPQVRALAPTKVVPLQGVQMHGQTPAQIFQTVYQPNMQMPMQIHPQQQQQPVVVSKSGPHIGGQQQVTVSAKSVSYEPTSGNVENGSGEKGGNPHIIEGQAAIVRNSYRPTQHVSSSNHGEIRLQYQSKPSQVQPPSQFLQQPQQSLSNSPTAPKPQRIKKARSRDSQHSTDTGSMLISNILEVCDLPSDLSMSEVHKLLQELVVSGGNIVLSGEQGDSQGDFNSNNQTISSETRVFAIFQDSSTSAHIMQTHSSGSYKLKPVESISESMA